MSNVENLNKLVGKLLVEEKINGLEAIILLGGQFDPIQCVLCELDYVPFSEKGEYADDCDDRPDTEPQIDAEKEIEKKFHEDWRKSFEEILKKKFEEQEERERIKRQNEDFLKGHWNPLPTSPYVPTEPWNPFAPSITPMYPTYPNTTPFICEACKRGGTCNCTMSQPNITCNTTGK